MRFEVASLITALTEGNGESEDSLEANFSAPGWVEPGTYAGREERSGRIILHSVVGAGDRTSGRLLGGYGEAWLEQVESWPAGQAEKRAGFWGS